MKYLFYVFLIFTSSYSDHFYCLNKSTTCTMSDGSTTDLSSSDFKGGYSLLSTGEILYETYFYGYSSCNGCISRVNFESNNQQYQSQRDLLNTELYNCQTTCNGNEACNISCQSAYDSKINQVKSNLSAAAFFEDGSKCNELYYDYNLGGVVNCNPNTGDTTLIGNATISPTGDLNCADGYYASSIPNMSVGTSGYNWNTQNCVSKVYNEELAGGGTITTIFDDNGQIESATYSNNGFTYTLQKDESGNLVGVIKDSTGATVETGSISLSDTGEYQYTSNSNTSLSNTSLNDFYQYTPTNNTNTGGTGSGTGGTGTNTGGTTGTNNNTNLDGLNQDYITPTTGTGGNSQTDVMNDLKGSVDSLNEQMKLNTLSNIGMSSQLGQLVDGLNGDGTSNQPSFDTGSYETFLSNLGNSFSNIQGTFDDTKNILDNGFSFDATKYDNYTDCTMSTTAFGKTITIDYCTAFIPFRAFITFLVTMVLIYHSIRIFFWGLK